MIASLPKWDDRSPHGGALKLHRAAMFGEVSIAQLQPQSPVNPPIGETGAPLANNYRTSGVAALSARASEIRTGRGGARNRADRESHALTPAQIGNLNAAERHAGIIGLPFTRMITIHWEAAGVPLAGMARATGRFIDLMSKALARNGSPTAWLWMHENSPGKGYDKGGHCHLLAYVPANLVRVVVKLQRRWLRQITGKTYQKTVIKSRPIGGRLGLEASSPDLHAANLEVAFAYLLKGASPDAASQFALELVKPSGRVIGKRCGTSQNIGAKARMYHAAAAC